MADKDSESKKRPGEHLGDMFDALGDAMGQIFNDPKLKEKAREMSKAVKESAETLGERFKDEEVRAKFRDVGKAAQAFGKSLSDSFLDDKDKNTDPGSKT